MRAIFKYTGDHNLELDEAVEKVLLKFGLKRYASGYDFKKGERDIAFDRDKRGE